MSQEVKDGIYAKMQKMFHYFEHDVEVDIPYEGLVLLKTHITVGRDNEYYIMSYVNAEEATTAMEINNAIEKLKLRHLKQLLTDMKEEGTQFYRSKNEQEKKDSNESSNESSDEKEKEKSELTEEDLQKWNRETTLAFGEYIDRMKKLRQELGNDKVIKYAKEYDESIEDKSDIIPANISEIVEYIENKYVS